MKEKNKKQLFISKNMSGKMEGMVSISTNPVTNDFCQAMSKKDDNICHECYALKYSKYRPNVVKTYQKNAELLSSRVLSMAEIPTLNVSFLRFNSFGELINEIHMENIINICRKNPHLTASIWTKRPNIVNKFKDIPKNLILVYSSPKMNIRSKLPKRFNKVFTVYDKEHIEKDNIKINCKQKCIECLKCYKTSDKDVYINEHKK